MRARSLWCGGGVTIATAMAIATACLSRAAAPADPVAEVHRLFENPPDDARMMVRWWWFGPAVTKDELERELRTMKDAGIGGVEVQPVYPLALDDPAKAIQNLPYLSDSFIEALRFTIGKAHELGMRLDLTLGSGWPFGGPQIALSQAAGRLRVERVAVPAGTDRFPLPALAVGESLVAVFLGEQSATEAVGNEMRVEPDANRDRTALVFIASHTRMMVKRAAVGAEGFVLDHYSSAAIHHYLETVGDRLALAFGNQPPYAIFSDSLEVERSDWTTSFREEFRKRRGYELLPYLPALASGTGEDAGAVRHDWGLTLTELANENYLTPLREWAHAHGTLFRSQTYGTPPVTLSSNALVDLPEGEGWTWRHFSATRWASSASHLYGRPVTSSETWTWVHSPAFAATPLDLKAEADLHFLQGINQLIGHGYPYSPASAGEPGWRFYAAGALNDHNPWWMVMPDVARYMQRMSFLLRQGKPANDVAIYLPTHDAYAAFTPGNVSVNKMMDDLIGPNVIPQVLDAGYNFDFIDDAAIMQGGIPYTILILPNVERMPLATYNRIQEFVRHAGIAVAVKRTPSLAPGMVDQNDRLQVRLISKELFTDPGARGHMVADETHLGAELHKLLDPDFQAAPDIGFVHRALEDGDLYFIANTANHPVRTTAVFRAARPEAAWWDPFTGKATRAAGNHVELNLAPYESRVIVFSKERTPAAPPATGPAPAPIEISGPWNDAAAWVNFSGKKTYETNVTIPAAALAGHHRLFLNFGEGTPLTAPERRAGNGMRAMLESPVREAAEVWVNGERAGSVWHPPYEVEIGPWLHAGANTLKITVANTAINEMAAQPLPDYRALNAKYGERFQQQDMNNLKSLPSGILGTVRLVAR